MHAAPPAGFAEPIRLALAVAGIEFENAALDKDALKQDLEVYNFGQCPR